MMARKLQIKRGQKVNMPALAAGELGFATDENTVYVGTGTKNVVVGGEQVTVDDPINDSDPANKGYVDRRTTPRIYKSILSANKWDGGIQNTDDLGESVDGKVVIVGLDENATNEQYIAAANAMFKVTVNEYPSVMCLGEIPTVDIPIVTTVLGGEW